MICCALNVSPLFWRAKYVPTSQITLVSRCIDQLITQFREWLSPLGRWPRAFFITRYFAVNYGVRILLLSIFFCKLREIPPW
jgi:hypothetical protein